MLNYPCRVLIVEDEPEDVNIVKTMLKGVRSAFFKRGFELTAADTLSASKQILARQEFDVILLDLMLPDSRHLKSLQTVQTLVSKTPIIVQTALEDEVVAVKALELGACGYLPKIAYDRNLLLYAIRSAIERKLQLSNLEQSQQQQQEQELDLLDSLLSNSLSFESQNSDRLQQRMPDVFIELEERYQGLLDRLIEEKIYKVEPDLAKQLDIIIEQLGYLQATARDLIELHAAVLKQKRTNLGQRKSQIFAIEGRYLLLELMGKLANYYRKYYMGLNKINLAHFYHNLSSSD